MSETARSRLRRWLELASGPPAFEADIPWREPPTLEARSPFAQLASRTFSGRGLEPHETQSLYQALQAAALGEPSRMWSDRLAIETMSGRQVADVDMRNHQFVAADRTCSHFADGYEPETLALIDLLVPDEGGFVDAGANWGYFSLHLATRPGFRGRIVAIEPSEERCAELRGLAGVAGLTDGISIRTVGLGDHSGAAFLTGGLFSGTARIVDAGDGGARSVSLARLDDLALSPAQFIKLDVEGSEAAALRGGRDYIREHMPWVSFERHADTSEDEFEAPFHELAGAGYGFALASARPVGAAGQPSALRLRLTRCGIPDRAQFPAFGNVVAIPPSSTRTPAIQVGAASLLRPSQPEPIADLSADTPSRTSPRETPRMPTLQFQPRDRTNPQSTFLRTFASGTVSQYGEEGIVQKILDVIGERNRWCVEFGAWDGKAFSNTYSFITEKSWSGVFFEGNEARFGELLVNFSAYKDKVFGASRLVGFQRGVDSLDDILPAYPIPQDFDFLVIDIDGNDYHAWRAMETYRPRVIVIEFNPTIPNDVLFIQDADMNVSQGSSLAAMIALGREKGYELVCVHYQNAFFVQAGDFPKFGIADNDIDAMCFLHEATGRIFHGYDGTIYTAGMPRLLWQNVVISPEDLQVLPKALRLTRPA